MSATEFLNAFAGQWFPFAISTSVLGFEQPLGPIVGHELFILAGVATVVGGWFLAHRHGTLRGVLTAEKGKTPGLHLKHH